MQFVCLVSLRGKGLPYTHFVSGETGEQNSHPQSPMFVFEPDAAFPESSCLVSPLKPLRFYLSFEEHAYIFGDLYTF